MHGIKTPPSEGDIFQSRGGFFQPISFAALAAQVVATIPVAPAPSSLPPGQVPGGLVGVLGFGQYAAPGYFSGSYPSSLIRN